jgi:hypothetical protein
MEICRFAIQQLLRNILQSTKVWLCFVRAVLHDLDRICNLLLLKAICLISSTNANEAGHFCIIILAKG